MKIIYLYFQKWLYNIIYILFINSEHFINMYETVQTVEPFKHHQIGNTIYELLKIYV